MRANYIASARPRVGVLVGGGLLYATGGVALTTLNYHHSLKGTGGFFDGSGKHYYLSIQHNITGHGVILDVSGWR